MELAVLGESQDSTATVLDLPAMVDFSTTGTKILLVAIIACQRRAPVSTNPPRRGGKPYPSASLEKALVRAQRIYEAHRATPLEREDAAKAMGYSSMSGPAAMTIGTLVSYGLLERAGKGMVKVTDLTKAILYPNGLDEKRQALREAGESPALFKAIRKLFGNDKATVEGIESYMRREEYGKNAPPAGSKAYMETWAFLETEGVSETDSAEPTAEAPQDDGHQQKTRAQPIAKEGFIEQFTIPVGNGIVVSVYASGTLGRRELHNLKRIVDYQESLLDDDVVSSGSAGTPPDLD